MRSKAKRSSLTWCCAASDRPAASITCSPKSCGCGLRNRSAPSPNPTISATPTICRRRAPARSCGGCCAPSPSARRSPRIPPRWKTRQLCINCGARNSGRPMDIRAAIENRQLLRFNYRGHERTVEPHIYGIDGIGHYALSGYQVGGGSESGQSVGWKLFRVDDIRSGTALPKHLESGGGGGGRGGAGGGGGGGGGRRG